MGGTFDIPGGYLLTRWTMTSVSAGENEIKGCRCTGERGSSCFSLLTGSLNAKDKLYTVYIHRETENCLRSSKLIQINVVEF